MRDWLSSAPVHQSSRGIASAGLWFGCRLAVVLLTAGWMLVVVILRLLRPFLMVPLLLVMIGGVGTACVFASACRWGDAAEAGAVAMASAALLVTYSLAAIRIDPNHFEPKPIPSWRRYL